ncbi:hypothetical protein G6F57_017365 [Rhizopus arrhizus]|nr:hypothetical protein G6F57_017365 [Rhizopus arrhizus]
MFCATRIDPDDAWEQWAVDSLERTSGEKTALLPNLGGSLPNDIFTDVLGLRTIWVPHSYPGCSQHAPNEHLPPELLRQALGLMTGLYWDLGAGGTPATAYTGCGGSEIVGSTRCNTPRASGSSSSQSGNAATPQPASANASNADAVSAWATGAPRSACSRPLPSVTRQWSLRPGRLASQGIAARASSVRGAPCSASNAGLATSRSLNWPIGVAR